MSDVISFNEQLLSQPKAYLLPEAFAPSKTSKQFDLGDTWAIYVKCFEYVCWCDVRGVYLLPVSALTDNYNWTTCCGYVDFLTEQ